MVRCGGCIILLFHDQYLTQISVYGVLRFKKYNSKNIKQQHAGGYRVRETEKRKKFDRLTTILHIYIAIL